MANAIDDSRYNTCGKAGQMFISRSIPSLVDRAAQVRHSVCLEKLEKFKVVPMRSQHILKKRCMWQQQWQRQVSGGARDSGASRRSLEVVQRTSQQYEANCHSEVAD